MKLTVVLAFLMLIFVPNAKAWSCPAGQIRQQAATGTPGGVVIDGLTFICVPTPGSTTNTSTNTNTNSNVNNNVQKSNQNQHQQQSQTQNATPNSSSTANGNGVGNGDNSNDTTFKDVHQTASAIAPPQFPTSPCFKSIGGAAQGGLFGASFGGGKIDQNCAIIETAKVFAANGSKLAYCKTMLTNKFAKKAGITLDDCMGNTVSVQDERFDKLESIVGTLRAVVSIHNEILEKLVAPQVGGAGLTFDGIPINQIMCVEIGSPDFSCHEENGVLMLEYAPKDFPKPVAPELKKHTMKRVAKPCGTIIKGN